MQKNSRSTYESVSVSVRCDNRPRFQPIARTELFYPLQFQPIRRRLTSRLLRVVHVWFVFDVKGHCGWRVFSLLLSLFNCEQFHSLRIYRTSELELELIYCQTRAANPVSKTQNRHETELACSPQTYSVSVYPYQTESFIGQRFNHASKSGVQIQHIELKVQSGNISEQN